MPNAPSQWPPVRPLAQERQLTFRTIISKIREALQGNLTTRSQTILDDFASQHSLTLGTVFSEQTNFALQFVLVVQYAEQVQQISINKHMMRCELTPLLSAKISNGMPVEDRGTLAREVACNLLEEPKMNVHADEIRVFAGRIWNGDL